MTGSSGAVRITKRVLDQADLSRGRHQIWDSELKGFGVQVEASGTKTYMVRYRPKGLGRDGPRRFFKIGRHGDLTADEARLQAKAILGRVASGEDPAAKQVEARADHVRRKEALTFKALGERFLREHVEAKRKGRTLASYTTLLIHHAYPVVGDEPAAAITRADLSQLHLAMRELPHSGNRLMAVVGSMYAFGAKQGLVPEGCNPARGIEKYREQARERYLNGDELQRLGAALAEGETVGIPWDLDLDHPMAKHVPKAWKGRCEKLDPHAAAALRLLLLTGARLREILDLRWREVDLERGLLLLPDSKTGRKTIVLSDAALAVIRSLIPSNGLSAAEREGGYVIKGLIEGKPRADLKKPWAAIQRHAQLEGVRLHDLRHTFASIGAGASLGLPIVGKLLGHSQPQTTARYAHLDADPLRRATNLIGEHLRGALQAKT
ncbi:MAG: site-specific integrase [Rhizobiales bacterium]|nr:site-specific integrase [Hyphomicrobiales bacterium]